MSVIHLAPQEAIKLANIKAEELGYKVSDMNVEVSKSGKIISVYFSPKQQADMVVVGGGDLTVFIDSESMAINEVLRGQ